MRFRPSLVPLLAVLAALLTACAGGTGAGEMQPSTPSPQTAETQAATTTPQETAAQTAEPPPAETPAPTDEHVHDFSVEELFAHIPPELIEYCPEEGATDDLRELRSIEVLCHLPDGSGANVVRYRLLAAPSDLEQAYLQMLEGFGVTQGQGECPSEIPSEGSYDAEGAPNAGRFACGTIVNGGARIVWTDERFAMVMEAARDDGDMATLFEWWARPESGPVE